MWDYIVSSHTTTMEQRTITYHMSASPGSIPFILGFQWGTINGINEKHMGCAHVRLAKDDNEKPYFIIVGYPSHVVKIAIQITKLDMKAKLRPKPYPQEEYDNHHNEYYEFKKSPRKTTLDQLVTTIEDNSMIADTNDHNVWSNGWWWRHYKFPSSGIFPPVELAHIRPPNKRDDSSPPSSSILSDMSREEFDKYFPPPHSNM